MIDFSSYMVNAGSDADIQASAQVVEQILDRVIPRWRTSVPADDNEVVNVWCQHVEAVRRAKVQLTREAELAEKLGEDAPRLSAGHMHPWVWGSARTLWASGHFREAVSASARAVNAHTQTKLGRRDVSETKLFQEGFSISPPLSGKPRLRIMDDDGSDTFKSCHRGAMAFAEGLFAGIRNPANHDLLPELPEDEALEQLAAFSILARWTDAAAVDRLP